MNAKESQPISVDLTGNYVVAFDYDVDNNPIYIGKSDVGSSKSAPVWQIKKLTYSNGNLVDVQYANGSPSFNNVWNDRVSLSYL